MSLKAEEDIPWEEKNGEQENHGYGTGTADDIAQVLAE